MSEHIGEGVGGKGAPGHSGEGGCGCACERRPAAGAGGTPQGERPAWAVDVAATHTFDARPMVAAGEHPVGEVVALLGTLKGREVLQLLTPFVPEPLVARASGLGLAAYSAVEGPGLVRTFFRRGEG